MPDEGRAFADVDEAFLKKWEKKIRSAGSSVNTVGIYMRSLRTVYNEVIKKATIKQFIKTTNKWLKRLGKKLELPLELTTYVARHSFATVLKRSGVSTAIISEGMGHKSEKTTQNYLDAFEDEVLTITPSGANYFE